MKFTISFFLFSLFILSVFVGLITSVDPYDKLGNNPFGFKTKAVAQSRENKFILFENSTKNYEALIIGSSTAHRFPTATVEELTGLKTFNYAAQHTTPEDYIAILRHALSKTKLKRIFLQVGFIEMNEFYETDNRLFNSSLNKYLGVKKPHKNLFDNNYLTLDAIRDSLRVIYVNKFGKAIHSNYVEDGNYKKEKLIPGPVKLSQSSYGEWKMNESRVTLLEEFRDLCLKNNIQLDVFTAPLSWQHIQIAHKAQGYQEYITTLKKVFGNFWDFHHDSLKEYSTYKEFRNSTHPTPYLSEQLLIRMITGKGPIIGILR
jgi:hypothetical protein